MLNKYIVFSLLLLISSVSAVPNGRCIGNVLEYYDLTNNVVKHDCSILHASNGLVFRGECKTYNNGQDADCWRTGGNVTFDYRNTISAKYNLSASPWDDPYLPPISSSTTTTLVSTTTIPSSIVCPVCVDCSFYKNQVAMLNLSNDNNKKNAEAYKQQAASCISQHDFDASMAEKDNLVKTAQSQVSVCVKDRDDAKGWNNTYMIAAGLSIAILVIFVYIWARYDGSKLADPFYQVAGGKSHML
jgi:hypothetical protein